MPEKKQYYAIDLMKFALAVLLICAHASSEKLSFPVYIDIWFSLYIIAVPFFFGSVISVTIPTHVSLFKIF